MKSKQPAPPPRKSKKSGNPAGSRHNVSQAKQTQRSQQAPKDPRHGSKKPVPLTPVTEKRPLSAKQELAAIEVDKRLDDLLDRQESGEVLSGDDAVYLQQQLARHQALCEALGIQPDVEDDEAEDSQV